ncbi:hypothetical protein VNO80_25971 [Phaseolus coccineus]|uniref:Uncharacterized protein n=1 Tax=Phaseolus coccineus TaxID=3886 RepID=A0AAN9QMA9_PHACN
MDTLPQKINLISCESMIHISDIKLIRTDTTLDLSQKAEKDLEKEFRALQDLGAVFFCIHIKLIRTDTTLDLSQKAEKGRRTCNQKNSHTSQDGRLAIKRTDTPHRMEDLQSNEETHVTSEEEFVNICKTRAMPESLSSKPLQLALSQKKINLISYEPMVHISDIKLIRTDTTLDLSQKAEKGMISTVCRNCCLASFAMAGPFVPFSSATASAPSWIISSLTSEGINYVSLSALSSATHGYQWFPEACSHITSP